MNLTISSLDMNERPNSQKRPLSQLDDDNFYCPDCKDLEEHRNKNCSKQLLTQTTSSSNTIDMNYENDHIEKRHCYRCTICQLSFTTNQHLQDHIQEFCLRIPFLSVQSCMETLKFALQLRDICLNSFRTARFQAFKVLSDYSGAKQRKKYSFKAFSEVMDKKHGTWSAEQQNILSHAILFRSQQLNRHLYELELARTEVNRITEKVLSLGHTTLTAGTKVISACFEALDALQDQRFEITLSLQSQARKLKNIKRAMRNNSVIVTELMGGMTALEDSVADLLETSSSESESDRDSNASAAESESDMDADN